eukprot:COSAG05_NODE_1282_length_5283_cov_4.584684_8_plen_180_part_00
MFSKIFSDDQEMATNQKIGLCDYLWTERSRSLTLTLSLPVSMALSLSVWCCLSVSDPGYIVCVWGLCVGRLCASIISKLISKHHIKNHVKMYAQSVSSAQALRQPAPLGGSEDSILFGTQVRSQLTRLTHIRSLRTRMTEQQEKKENSNSPLTPPLHSPLHAGGGGGGSSLSLFRTQSL